MSNYDGIGDIKLLVPKKGVCFSKEKPVQCRNRYSLRQKFLKAIFAFPRKPTEPYFFSELKPVRKGSFFSMAGLYLPKYNALCCQKSHDFRILLLSF